MAKFPIPTIVAGDFFEVEAVESRLNRPERLRVIHYRPSQTVNREIEGIWEFEPSYTRSFLRQSKILRALITKGRELLPKA